MDLASRRSRATEIKRWWVLTGPAIKIDRAERPQIGRFRISAALVRGFFSQSSFWFPVCGLWLGGFLSRLCPCPCWWIWASLLVVGLFSKILNFEFRVGWKQPDLAECLVPWGRPRPRGPVPVVPRLEQKPGPACPFAGHYGVSSSICEEFWRTFVRVRASLCL